jgi:hypothetical protein
MLPYPSARLENPAYRFVTQGFFSTSLFDYHFYKVEKSSRILSLLSTPRRMDEKGIDSLKSAGI